MIRAARLRGEDRGALALERDRRGGQLLEYAFLVVMAFVASAGAVHLGRGFEAKLEAYAKCVTSLSCAGDDDGWATPAGPPPQSTPWWLSNPSDWLFGRVEKVEPITPEQLALAKTLVRPGGSATQADADVVAADLARLPRPVLEYMKASGIDVIAVKNSVVDYRPDLAGQRPRGWVKRLDDWSSGPTWDSVPGMSSAGMAIIATRRGGVPARGNGSGAKSVTIHESFHAIDYMGGWSHEPEFVEARDADARKLSAYELQPGNPGEREAFAMSAEYYFLHDEAWGREHPHLWRYWETHEKKIRKP
jgi:hypothetical protein